MRERGLLHGMYPMATMQGSMILGLLSTNANIVRLSKTEQTRMNMQSDALSPVTFFLTVTVQACVLLLGASRNEQEIYRVYYMIQTVQASAAWTLAI